MTSGKYTYFWWRLKKIMSLKALWEPKVLYKCRMLVLTNDFCILQFEKRWQVKLSLWGPFQFSHDSFFAKNCFSVIHYSRTAYISLKNKSKNPELKWVLIDLSVHSCLNTEMWFALIKLSFTKIYIHLFGNRESWS